MPKYVTFGDDMTPLDEGSSLDDLVRQALRNIERYDKPPIQDAGDLELRGPQLTPREKMRRYLRTKSEAIRKLAKACPMDRIYRVKGGIQSERFGYEPLAVILGYGSHHGQPYAGVMILGIKLGLGSAEEPLMVPPDGLEDVTEACRQRTLGALRVGGR
jgi:hypothetical protein